MALMVFYNQIRDDQNEVEYLFGATEKHLDRRLIIDKQTRQIRDPDNKGDGLPMETAGHIFHRFRKEGTWPTRGLIQA
ncbi:hypothetical protein [Nocardia wallacei]|uniref:hypothetical protein n=1 Tax=Nocardia wallacei TaxID=480035 RepID=UPI00245820EF|nr:hypothetical protein [Nocardia wallacei]